MATGLATSQGWSPQMVAGIDRVPVASPDGQFLFNQLSLTSTTGDIAGQNQLPAFGKKALKKVNALNKVNADIRFLKSV